MAKTTIPTDQIRDNAITLAKLGSLTTKGDILTHDGSDHIRLPVGTDGYILVADSGEASGLNWIANSGGGLAAGDFVFNEVPSGTVNGSNDTFTLANTPETGTVVVQRNGVTQLPGSGNDYQISSSTITFEAGNLPVTGDNLTVSYIKA